MIHVGGAHELFRRITQQFTSEGSPIDFTETRYYVFKNKNILFSKHYFLTLGLGICEGVSEGSRHGSGWVTFSSISCRYLSRDLYVLLECLVCHCMST